MREWWNWYTRMLEGHVPQGLEVQVLSRAPKLYISKFLDRITEAQNIRALSSAG